VADDGWGLEEILMRSLSPIFSNRIDFPSDSLLGSRQHPATVREMQ